MERCSGTMHSEVRDKNPQVICNTLSVPAPQSLKGKKQSKQT
jgi:hypothetical protein